MDGVVVLRERGGDGEGEGDGWEILGAFPRAGVESKGSGAGEGRLMSMS